MEQRRKREIYNLPSINEVKSTGYDNQKRLISENQVKIDKNNPPRISNVLPLFNTHNSYDNTVGDRFDPYLEYLTTHGLADDRETGINYIFDYINIDSSQRKIIPQATIANVSSLANNPLKITSSSTTLTITQDNHQFVVNDKIVLYGLTTSNIVIRLTEDSPFIEFQNGKSYATINYANGIDSSLLSSYDVSNLTFTLSGFLGNVGSTFINNMPINLINGLHDLILANPDTGVYSTTKFYFSLPFAFVGTYTPASYNVTLQFNYICGIPINFINANIPVSSTYRYPYHIITAITSSTYTVTLNKSAGSSSTGFGGLTVQVGKITNIVENYSNPNQYIIELPKELYNIIRVRLISSEFPNTSKNITSSNCKFYWENIDDGNYVYSVTLDPGFYTPDLLKSTLESKIYNTERVNYATDVANEVTPQYTNHNYISVNIDTNSGIVTLYSYLATPLSKPIINISPPISSDPTLDPAVPATDYILTFNHPNHGFSVGTKITICGAITVMGISPLVLNREQTIYQVLSVDSYTIKLSSFNLLLSRNNNGGGAGIKIYSPYKIRLRFDYSDSLGGTLGFRDIGEATSVTTFATTHQNNDLYDEEEEIDYFGNATTITQDPINFAGDGYLTINCKEFEVIENLNSTEDDFAKILLPGTYGTLLYNTFVDMFKVFYKPIDTLRELTLSFYRPNRELVDFENINHSFTIEIIGIRKSKLGTNIDSRVGFEA